MTLECDACKNCSRCKNGSCDVYSRCERFKSWFHSAWSEIQKKYRVQEKREKMEVNSGRILVERFDEKTGAQDEKIIRATVVKGLTKKTVILSDGNIRCEINFDDLNFLMN